ncbi:MAG: FG-GAP-like repeat-containing protein [Ignavibacteriaceae bacterium]
MQSKIIYTLCLLFTITIHSQQFVKVTEGAHVNDGGDSRAVNWVDYDNDGWLDLFVTNGPSGGQNNFLYRNNGDGSFTKETGIAITSDNRSSDGSSWGDFDNDGHTDLFVANWYNQDNLLYKNNGDGTFTLLSASVPAADQGYSETGTWGDYNNDGFLDLYVCNSEGTRRNFLYKNNGDGSFTKITNGAPVTDAFYSRNADWIDINNDGLVDLFVVNENNQNQNLYRNDGEDTFSQFQIPSLLNFGGNSASSNWEDVNNDGHFDLFIANYQNQQNQLLINNGDETFTDVNNDPVVNDAGNSFGSCLGDVDNDGDLDLFVTNAFSGTKKINFFYLNNGDGTFTKDTTTFAADSGWSYGCAFGDYDKDGYLDLFIAKCFGANENNALYKNSGGTNNWLLMNLEGIISNRSAIGAIVKLKADISGTQLWQTRRVAGQNGYCGQNLQIHFGLGDAAVIDSMIINWPSGIKQVYTDLDVNEIINVVEDTTLLTSVYDEVKSPAGYELHQNYPNPFNPATVISWQSPFSSQHTLKVYDSLGKVVATLVDEFKPAGSYEVEFSAGDGITSGVYYYNLEAGDFTSTRKMILLR